MTESLDLEQKNKQDRASKMMLWFGIISMTMMFAGLTSAYVVSKTRPDWVANFSLPNAFMGSTLSIILSSITLHFAWIKLKSRNRSYAVYFTLATIVLGFIFVTLQFVGFSQIIKAGYYFTGSGSTVTSSFIYILTLTHLAHIVFALLVLIFVFFRLINDKYIQGNTTGFELAKTFWHFVDILWIYLFLFLYFFG